MNYENSNESKNQRKTNYRNIYGPFLETNFCLNARRIISAHCLIHSIEFTSRILRLLLQISHQVVNITKSSSVLLTSESEREILTSRAPIAINRMLSSVDGGGRICYPHIVVEIALLSSMAGFCCPFAFQEAFFVRIRDIIGVLLPHMDQLHLSHSLSSFLFSFEFRSRRRRGVAKTIPPALENITRAPHSIASNMLINYFCS